MTRTFHARSTPGFWDRIAPKYAGQPVKDPEAYERKLSCLRRTLRPTDRILELGCGTGTTALKLAPHLAQVTATDASRVMIEIARSKQRSAETGNVTFHQADADAAIEGGPFDAVCAFSLLHLVPDVHRVASMALDQLKPGGLFISKTVCLNDAPAPIRLLVRVLMVLGIAPKVTFLGRADLVRDLKAAGFGIESSTYFNKTRVNPFIVARKPLA